MLRSVTSYYNTSDGFSSNAKLLTVMLSLDLVKYLESSNMGDTVSRAYLSRIHSLNSSPIFNTTYITLLPAQDNNIGVLS